MTASGSACLRRELILVQFVLSMMLIVGAATVYDPLDSRSRGRPSLEMLIENH